MKPPSNTGHVLHKRKSDLVFRLEKLQTKLTFMQAEQDIFHIYLDAARSKTKLLSQQMNQHKKDIADLKELHESAKEQVNSSFNK